MCKSHNSLDVISFKEIMEMGLLGRERGTLSGPCGLGSHFAPAREVRGWIVGVGSGI